jgi:hypothetical protein
MLELPPSIEQLSRRPASLRGGFLVGADVTVRTSSPNFLPNGTGWRVDARNTGAVQRTVTVYALCVPMS